MAESNSIVPEKLLCRFFAMSTCREGELCRFSHDVSITTLDNVCRYHLEGRCYFGPRCRYDHVKMKPIRYKHKKNIPSKPLTQSSRSTENTTQSAASSANQSNSSLSKGRVTDMSRNSKISLDPEILKWANAPEFVPKSKQMSYAEKLMIGQVPAKESKCSSVICAYYCDGGDCPFGDNCDEIHGEVCEICGLACLLPFDMEQQKRHKEQCEKELVENMEHSFAVQRSKDKTCGICFDIIMEKQPMNERRFGIMASCNHVFCLSCIRKWRQVKPDIQSFENTVDTSVTRACPECRLPSDFIVPNSYWVDDENEKKELIDTYKKNLSKKHCKYFRKGEGNCPFGGACFYLHQYPDGSKAVLPPPTRRRRENQDGDLDFVERIFLSDFFTNHDDPLLMNVSFSDLVYVLSESDDDSDESFSFFFDEQL